MSSQGTIFASRFLTPTPVGTDYCTFFPPAILTGRITVEPRYNEGQGTGKICPPQQGFVIGR